VTVRKAGKAKEMPPQVSPIVEMQSSKLSTELELL
jgi:hypothetical protein